MFTAETGFDAYVGNTFATAWDDAGGYGRMQLLADVGSLAVDWAYQDYKVEAPIMSTGWFIPSISQWIAMLCKPGLGDATTPDMTRNVNIGWGGSDSRENFNKRLRQIDGADLLDGRYWSLSAWNGSSGVTMAVSVAMNTRVFYNMGNIRSRVRLVFAF